jgi:phosphoribosyl 1,2-cyclic phosphodiesterase
MVSRFCVLASGSSGNASFLEHNGFGLLIDCGIGPQVMSERLHSIGQSWAAVSAVLLTHTHRDHWSAHSLAHLRRLQIPLYAHPQHHDRLAAHRDYAPLRRAELVREYLPCEQFMIHPLLSCVAVPIPHDSEPTFAFRIEGRDPEHDGGWSLGYVSDLGQATSQLVDVLCGVDALALEFNHDVEMQRRSRRPKMLIDRVLGKYGHLSNDQAADLARTIARSHAQGGFQFLAQLHLSRECNRPELAEHQGRAALQSVAPRARVITSSQSVATTPIGLRSVPRSAVSVPLLQKVSRQLLLPGFDAD